MKSPDFDPDFIRDQANLFFEHREDGLYWKRRTSNRCVIGRRVGVVDHKGYRMVGFLGRLRAEHRLIWLMVTGEFPDGVDHINGTKDDNRLENLRECTQAQNTQNRGISSNNKSGYIGVSFHKGKWVAKIRANGVRHHLGRFDSPELAFSAYVEAKARLHIFNPIIRKP